MTAKYKIGDVVTLPKLGESVVEQVQEGVTNVRYLVGYTENQKRERSWVSESELTVKVEAEPSFARWQPNTKSAEDVELERMIAEEEAAKSAE